MTQRQPFPHAANVTPKAISAQLKQFVDTLNAHNNELTTLGHSKALHRFAESMGYKDWHTLRAVLNEYAFKTAMQEKYGLSDAYADAAYRTLDSSLTAEKEGDELADYYCFRYGFEPVSDSDSGNSNNAVTNMFRSFVGEEITQILNQHNDAVLNYLQGNVDDAFSFTDLLNGKLLNQVLCKRLEKQSPQQLRALSEALEHVDPNCINHVYEHIALRETPQCPTPFNELQKTVIVTALARFIEQLTETLLRQMDRQWSEERDYISEERDDLQVWFDRHTHEKLSHMLSN